LARGVLATDSAQDNSLRAVSGEYATCQALLKIIFELVIYAATSFEKGGTFRLTSSILESV